MLIILGAHRVGVESWLCSQFPPPLERVSANNALLSSTACHWNIGQLLLAFNANKLRAVGSQPIHTTLLLLQRQHKEAEKKRKSFVLHPSNTFYLNSQTFP